MASRCSHIVGSRQCNSDATKIRVRYISIGKMVLPLIPINNRRLRYWCADAVRPRCTAYRAADRRRFRDDVYVISEYRGGGVALGIVGAFDGHGVRAIHRERGDELDGHPEDRVVDGETGAQGGGGVGGEEAADLMVKCLHRTVHRLSQSRTARRWP